MGSAAKHDADARPDGRDSPASDIKLIPSLPALIESAPAPPAPAERLQAAPEDAPEDASESFAFALWNAGRKNEAVEFLERQIARHRDDALPGEDDPAAATAAAEPAASSAWAGPTISVAPAVAVPPQDIVLLLPLPRRPFIVGAALLALVGALAWGGFDRIAALPGWLGAPEAALQADVVAGPAAGAAPVVKLAAAEESAMASDAALPPVRIVGEAPPAEEAAVTKATPADATATAAPAAPPSPAAGETPPDQGVAAADDDPQNAAPVTLATLADRAMDNIGDEPRLPRPRPAPSPETVAALAAAPTAPPAPAGPQLPPGVGYFVPEEPEPTVVAEQEKPAFVPAPRYETPSYEPPLYEPNAAAGSPRGFEIIGRVVRPGLALRRAAAERYVALRRALAERRAAAYPRIGPYSTIDPYSPADPYSSIDPYSSADPYSAIDPYAPGGPYAPAYPPAPWVAAPPAPQPGYPIAGY